MAIAAAIRAAMFLSKATKTARLLSKTSKAVGRANKANKKRKIYEADQKARKLRRNMKPGDKENLDKLGKQQSKMRKTEVKKTQTEKTQGTKAERGKAYKKTNEMTARAKLKKTTRANKRKQQARKKQGLNNYYDDLK